MEWHEDGRVLVTVHEMVTFSVFHYLGTAAQENAYPIRRADRAARTALGLFDTFPLSHEFISGEYTFSFEGYADALTTEGRTDVLTLAFLVESDPEVIDPMLLRAARAEALILAYAAREARGRAPVLTMIFYHPESGKHTTLRESTTKAKLVRFFERISLSLSLCAAAELDRITRRLPAMRALRFPYRERRLGQEELMQDVYRSIARGERLFASAPTGIGKTVSTLYPAVRAMGDGKCDKLFYLTAKATAARMAAETAALLGKDGALRAVLLASKERICPRHGRPCREGMPCERSKGGAHEDMALSDLLSLSLPLIGPDEILAAADRHNVCPHELSLRYSMLSDLVICDYNYLFDPAVRLSRYFAFGGRFCFLIDEAHNLPDRVRDTYTVSLSEKAIAALSIPEGIEHPAARQAEAARGELLSYFSAYLAPLAGDGDKNTENGLVGDVRRTLPDGLTLRLASLCEPLGRLYREVRSLLPRIRTHIRSFYYDLKTILGIFECYDAGFRLHIYRDDAGDVTFRTLCLDPAGVVSRCLDDGRCAVLFSATLSPIEYYRDVLGGDAGTPTLALASPFERDNLQVAVMDRISTRYADREETLGDVAAAVITTARARRGNYMVFCPSFAYAERLAGAVAAMAPDLRILRQGRTMSAAERAAFLVEFEHPEAPVLAICVLGGIWGEGVDLSGDRLVGAIIIGVGLGTPDPLHEVMASYFNEKSENGREYAYLYPGMNRVLQAAGRVIRDEGDVGVVLLIDDRYATPFYRELLPEHWHGLTYVGNNRSLAELLRRFWARHPKE